MNWHPHKHYNSVLNSISDSGIHYHSYGLWLETHYIVILFITFQHGYSQSSSIRCLSIQVIGNSSSEIPKRTSMFYYIYLQYRHSNMEYFLKLQYFLLRKNWRSQTAIKRNRFTVVFCMLNACLMFSLTKDFVVFKLFWLRAITWSLRLYIGFVSDNWEASLSHVSAFSWRNWIISVKHFHTFL